MSNADLGGAGGVRKLASRWVIEASLVFTSPVRIGNGEEGATVDLALLRDELGAPLFPGSSIAGALRSFAGRLRAEDRGSLMQDVEAILGGDREDAAGGQSALIVFDAHGEIAAPEIRDGVSLDPRTGTAAAHARYDQEVWPSGTKLPIRLELLVPVSWGALVESRRIGLLARVLDALERHEVVLGARSTRGLGRCNLERVAARRFDLTSAEGWNAWLATGLADAPKEHLRDFTQPGTALETSWPTQDAAAFSTYANVAGPRTLEVRIPLVFNGGVLIASPQDNATGADVRQLRSAGHPVLSGSSVAGALRQRARRIAVAVHGEGFGEVWVDRLFGPEPRKGPLRASRLSVEESLLSGWTDLQITRIQIDRSSQAPVDGALLQEEPAFGGSTEVRLSLRWPGADDALGGALAGFLALLVKDVLLGDVPVGGTAGIGRGAVLDPTRASTGGSARQASFRLDGVDHRLELTPGEPPPKPLRDLLETWVEAFHGYREREEQR